MLGVCLKLIYFIHFRFLHFSSSGAAISDYKKKNALFPSSWSHLTVVWLLCFRAGTQMKVCLPLKNVLLAASLKLHLHGQLISLRKVSVSILWAEEAGQALYSLKDSRTSLLALCLVLQEVEVHPCAPSQGHEGSGTNCCCHHCHLLWSPAQRDLDLFCLLGQKGKWRYKWKELEAKSEKKVWGVIPSWEVGCGWEKEARREGKHHGAWDASLKTTVTERAAFKTLKVICCNSPKTLCTWGTIQKIHYDCTVEWGNASLEACHTTLIPPSCACAL